MKTISLDETIHSLVIRYPESKNILVELGFKDVIIPVMLQTAGKMMTLRKGSNFKKIELKTIIQTFESYGFKIEE